MDKKIFAIFILILLAMASIAGIVSVANIQAQLKGRVVATMTKEGMNLIDPVISNIIKLYVCATTPASCVGGLIKGQITENAYALIAQGSAGAAKVMGTYNQVRSYEGLGTDIMQELKFNEKGQISEGSLDVKEEIKIGNHIGELKEDDVKVKNTRVEFDREAGITTIKFKRKGHVEARGFHYKNIQKGGEIKLDSEGRVIEADITSSADTSYTFIVDDEERKIDVIKDTKVIFDGEYIYVIGKGKEFKFNDQSGFKVNEGAVAISKFGKNYEFAGEDFFAPGDTGPIHVQDGCFEIPETMKIGGKEITGRAISIAEGLVCVGGKLTITEKGSLLKGGKAEYNKIEMRVQDSPILIADAGADMADYKGNWIEVTEMKVNAQSAADGTIEEIRFLEGNEIVDIDEERMLAMKITNGDGMEIINRKEEGKIPLIAYHGPEDGTSKLKVGKFKFTWINKEPYVFLPKEQSEYKSAAIQLESPWDSVMETSLDNTFNVITPDEKERVLFD